MVFFIWPFFFVFWFFSSIHNTHTQKQMIKIVKLSLFTTGCIEEVRKDLREKKRRKEVTISLPYVCRGYKALVHLFLMSAESAKPWVSPLDVGWMRIGTNCVLSWWFLAGTTAVLFLLLFPFPHGSLPQSLHLQKLLKLEIRQPVFLETFGGCLEIGLENASVLQVLMEKAREDEEENTLGRDCTGSCILLLLNFRLWRKMRSRKGIEKMELDFPGLKNA